MFGLGLPFLSYFRRQLGLRGEAADATGSLHAKTAVLGIPNPSTAGRDTVMNYCKRLDQLVSICVPTETIQKALDVSRTTASRGSGSSTLATTLSKVFIAARGGKIRIKFTGLSSSGSYPGGYCIYVDGSNVTGSISISSASTVYTHDVFVKDFSRVELAFWSGSSSYSSCGYTYYSYYGVTVSLMKVCYDMAEGAFVVSD